MLTVNWLVYFKSVLLCIKLHFFYIVTIGYLVNQDEISVRQLRQTVEGLDNPKWVLVFTLNFCDLWMSLPQVDMVTDILVHVLLLVSMCVPSCVP